MNIQQLNEELAAKVREVILEAEKVKALSDQQFNQKRSDGGWSTAQILVHLNFYSDFYVPKLEGVVSGNQIGMKDYKPGWLGNYFTKLMQPDSRGEVSKKMKSPSNASPQNGEYTKEILDKFLNDQQRILRLFKQHANMDFNQRLPISISSLIKLKTGDVLRFLIAHEQRHIAQMKRLLQEI